MHKLTPCPNSKEGTLTNAHKGTMLVGNVELDDERSGDLPFAASSLTTFSNGFEMKTDLTQALFLGARISKNKCTVG